MSEKRNLIVGCDGTWNEPESKTNVQRFLDSVRQTETQVVHYEKGVGTRAWEALPGGIYGYGLEKRILGCYRFLRKRFNERKWKPDQNRIYLLGFSRGAYTARRISGLLAHSGLPKKAADVQLGWEMYQERDATSARKLKQEGRFFDVPIQMVGVWDTVKATNDADYHDKKLAENVVSGYHAVAIDEKRKFFPALRWNRDRRALEVWFAGVHSDVGGGYKERGLSDITLLWMIYRAIGEGVVFRRDKVEAIQPNPRGKLHDSCVGHWKLLGERVRTIPKSALIHPSVKKKLEAAGNYAPEKLPAEPNYWEPPSG